MEFVATKCTHRIAEIPNSWETQITYKVTAADHSQIEKSVHILVVYEAILVI